MQGTASVCLGSGGSDPANRRSVKWGRSRLKTWSQPSAAQSTRGVLLFKKNDHHQKDITESMARSL